MVAAEFHNPVVVVSGLPRSGTSMMMRMLEAGGIEAMKDGIRKADDDNPGGYYEFERVKQTKEDPSWVSSAAGKAVKMISRLLFDLPTDSEYKVVFMRRDLDEVLASQKRMLERRGEKSKEEISDEKMKEIFETHLADVQHLLAIQEHFSVHYVWYNDLMKEPKKQLGEVSRFLGGSLNTDKMVDVIDENLYHQRR